MSNEILELKQFVNDTDFISKMNLAFSDLRADYELTIDSKNEKINELQNLHVDVKNKLSDLTSFSRNASGLISGLRGTGKTHLLLLARNQLNSTLWKANSTNNLCIYINMKRLCIPDTFDHDLFNRIFTVFIYDELAKQLTSLLDNFSQNSIFRRFLNIFNKDKTQLKNNVQNAILSIYTLKLIAHKGNEIYTDTSTGKYETEEFRKDIQKFTAKLNSSLSFKDANISLDIDESSLEELSNRMIKNNTYEQYLNFQSLRTELIKIIQLLQLDSITFYVDEWEKINYNPKVQEYTAFYIDRIIDDPLYFWISVVPYRGNLFCLENGSDLQHSIDLDETLIYEASSIDSALCINYFKDLVNKRLYFYFNDEQINYNLLFNNDSNFIKLILASMGNTRDFGTMLLKSWSEYQSYRNSTKSQGRPYKYISNHMVISAIKNNGDKKLTNVENDQSTLKVWNDIKSYCMSKNSSHFAIEETGDNLDCLREQEYSDLIYHRLLHFRKAHVPSKDASTDSKLAIYAINYASSYTLHAKGRKLTFITEYKVIHDRVRRYVYEPSRILKEIKIKSSEVFPCYNCSESINMLKMKGAWDNNSCPFGYVSNFVYSPKRI